MARRSSLHIFIFALAACFVTVSQAKQQVLKLSQNRTAIESSSELLEAVKYLPIILDSKKIDFITTENTPPKRFDVTIAYGPGSGGGGNACAMGIVKLTKQILQQNFNQTLLQRDQEQALKAAMQTAIFVQGENLHPVRGEKKNAINFPDLQLVVVDNKACEVIVDGGAPGFSLLVHEYMGLANIDDRDYNASWSFIEKLSLDLPNGDRENPIITAYMNTFECAPGQSWSACLDLAGDRAEKEMNLVLNKLSVCVEKSKRQIENPSKNLRKEQAAFMKYVNLREYYLPENGQHLAQSSNAARLLLILQRTDFLKDALRFCSR
ncbi:MAG: hypothetical protein ACXVCP_07540 [Bdellovibrio sp.]